MKIETDPIKNFEKSVKVGANMAAKIVGTALGVGNSVNSLIRVNFFDRRVETVDNQKEALHRLDRYRDLGHFLVVGGAGGASDKQSQRNAAKAASVLSRSGVTSRAQELGIVPVVSNQSSRADRQRRWLIRDAEFVREEIRSADDGALAMLVDGAVTMDKSRPGTPSQQALAGFNRIIRTFEGMVSPESPPKRENLAIVAVVNPFQAREVLNIPRLEVGGVAKLVQVGEQSDEFRWQHVR